MKQFQQKLFKTSWKHQYSHGGELRKLRGGRGARPLSAKLPIHIVFKAERRTVPGGFRSSARFKITNQILQIYSRRFFIKLEKFTIQNDHIHLLVRTGRRSQLIHFMRVFAGQVAQIFRTLGLICGEVTKLWKARPFTRIVIGRNAFKIAMDYLEPNEMEVLGLIKYSKTRLREKYKSGMFPIK